MTTALRTKNCEQPLAPAKPQTVFNRKEIKYLLTANEYRQLMQLIAPYLEKDKYHRSTNCSIYFDTDEKYLALHSLEHPIYKEKIRLRSYNIPTLEDAVFIEIKKKFDGIGNKRRIKLKLKEFYDFQKTGLLPRKNLQIMKEIRYCFNFYHLKPALFLAYDRLAYQEKNNADFRVTFDANVRSRTKDLRLENGDYGQNHFDKEIYVMETKTLGAFPLWFSRALSTLRIYPASFSKYGRVCQKLINQGAKIYV